MSFAPAHLIRTCIWLLTGAAAIGTVMATLRFAKDRGAPVWMSKAHGVLTTSSLALLVYGCVAVGLPRMAVTATALLMLAAGGGFVMGQAGRWKGSSHIEIVLFGHLTVAAAGYFLLLAASMG